MDMSKLNAAQKAAYLKLTEEQQKAFAGLPEEQFLLMMTRLSEIITQTSLEKFFAAFDAENLPALNQLLKNAFDGVSKEFALTEPKDLMRIANLVKQHYAESVRQTALYEAPRPLTSAQVAELEKNKQ